MAKQGFNVLVIEKNCPNDVSRDYDVFHMGKHDMERFDMIMPEEGDPLREFSFAHSTMISPYGNYPKACAEAPVIGLHKHDYIMAMAERAKDAGAEFIYDATFTDFIYDDNQKIIGAKYKNADDVNEIYTRIVVDCSGIPAVARTKLPNTSVVGNFKLTNKENTYILAWTTTPWTLPSNLALCVNKAYTYVEVKANVGTDDEPKYENYILAKALCQYLAWCFLYS